MKLDIEVYVLITTPEGYFRSEALWRENFQKAQGRYKRLKIAGAIDDGSVEGVKAIRYYTEEEGEELVYQFKFKPLLF